ncbi:hypothetical protein OG762_02050 [Streptomyces sp. NBC_01136]|uniref:hypothetical protein n=1 Tax=unclassified Streptomyces TaxID=2593676 RepID=UPI003251D34A|nr:hypothetical protein OG762_02050 [Streptomyces sp. NBC_01136]
MNDTPSSVGSTAGQVSSSDLVQVVLDACSAADADTVFRALDTRFMSEGGGDAPRQDTTAHPDTWTGAFLVSRSAALPPDLSLAGSVTADLQGGPVAVNRLRETLASAFAVQVSGSTSGDQEVDIQLRLTSAAA